MISYELLDRSHSNFIGTLGISDDLINFWDKFIENKMTDGRHLKKKLVDAMSYEPYELHSNLVWRFTGYFL